jgi:hypothetical protein
MENKNLLRKCQTEDCDGKAKIISIEYNYYGDVKEIDIDGVSAVEKRICNKCGIDWYSLYTVIESKRASTIQKIAIESLEDIRGYKYDQLSISALGEVLDINTLTQDEADKIIEYGNNLDRKNQN